MPAASSRRRGGNTVTLTRGHQRCCTNPCERNRHDGRVGAFRDQGCAFVDLHRYAGRGHASFREQHGAAPVVQQLDHGLERRRTGGVHLDMLEPAEQRAHPAAPGSADVDGEDQRRRQEQVEQQAVQPRHVVGDEQRAGRRRLCMSEAAQLDAERHAHEQAQERAQRAARTPLAYWYGRPRRMARVDAAAVGVGAAQISSASSPCGGCTTSRSPGFSTPSATCSFHSLRLAIETLKRRAIVHSESPRCTR